MSKFRSEVIGKIITKKLEINPFIHVGKVIRECGVLGDTALEAYLNQLESGERITWKYLNLK